MPLPSTSLMKPAFLVKSTAGFAGPPVDVDAVSVTAVPTSGMPVAVAVLVTVEPMFACVNVYVADEHVRVAPALRAPDPHGTDPPTRGSVTVTGSRTLLPVLMTEKE